MIVLYEHHVVQTKAMINTPSCNHCSLFQCAEPGRGFACIQDLGWMVSNSIDKLARKGRDGAEMLQKVQRDTFRFQNRTRQAPHFDNNIASDNFVAIWANNLDVYRRINLPKNFPGSSEPGNDVFFTCSDASCC